MTTDRDDEDGLQDQAVARFLEIARESHASSGPGGITWTREDLYDRSSPR
ncbi:MAG: hypothetical protein LBK95_09675 [Bifidobacteriaceae bacterium]|nr:hypothetical protein [Bifidobacteriaceae bacterium]